MTTDGDLLRRYAGAGCEDAFAELVRRHLDLVYSAALRQVNGDVHLAQDVAQNVFSDLARKAASLAGRQGLTGWLYTSTHFAAAKAVRTEQRRRTHEQEAVSMRELLHDSGPESDWAKLRPMLDAVMHELNEADREAILLRFFENRQLAEIGGRFGLSEDAARKRVDRALEKLREHFAKRGITTTAAALSVVIATNTVQAAPVGLAVTISTAAALAGTTLAGTATATAIKTIAMTTLQKTLITAAIVAAVGTGIYEARQASTLRSENQLLRQQQAEQIQGLQSERSEAANRFSALVDEIERVKGNSAELLKLRSEVARLRNAANDPTSNAAKDWLDRVNRLKQLLEQSPGARIPELQFLTEQDWLNAAKEFKLETADDVGWALARVRYYAKQEFGKMAVAALNKFVESNGGQLPQEISQLLPFFDLPLDGTILQRYQVVQTGKAADVKLNAMNPWVLKEKDPVDFDYDVKTVIGLDTVSSETFDTQPLHGLLEAYKAANGGQEPSDPTKLLPYAKTDLEQASLQRLLKQAGRLKP